MPTSNGQIGPRNLRQNAVLETKINDGAVVTDKLDDLAITVEKTDDPVFVHVEEAGYAFNVTLTTTPTIFSTLTVDIPTWVGNMSVYVSAKLQFSASSLKNGIVTATVNEETQGNITQFSVDAGETGSSIDFNTFSTGSPGSTITVEAWASVNSGTNTSNQVVVSAIVIGTR